MKNLKIIKYGDKSNLVANPIYILIYPKCKLCFLLKNRKNHIMTVSKNKNIRYLFGTNYNTKVDLFQKKYFFSDLLQILRVLILND